MTANQRLDQMAEGYQNGHYTRAEVVGMMSEIAADVHPSIIEKTLPGDLVEQLREQTRERPKAPEEDVKVSGALPSAHQSPAPGDDDMKWYAGLWRLHYYF